MNVREELVHAAVLAPASVRRMSGRAWRWFFLFVALAGAILVGIAAILSANQEGLRHAALSYVLPESWVFPAELVFDYLLAGQQRVVLVNAVIGAALVVVGLVLFWVKEGLSKQFETDAELTDLAHGEHPVWFQGLEELKLLVLYLAGFMTIFWIGYPPEPWRRLLASILSFAFLFFTCAIDFIAPTLQRHKLRYSQVIKTLLKRPLGTLAFGAVFALPAVLLGHAFAGQKGLSLLVMGLVVFGVEVLAIAWAVVGGTSYAAKLLDEARQVRPSRPLFRIVGWVLLLGLFAVNVYAFGAIGMAVNAKSQVLKCEYSVDWSTAGLDAPRLGALLGGEVEVGAHVDVSIRNPTSLRVELEENRLELTHEKTTLATTQLTPVEVPAGETVTQRVDFKLELDAKALLKGPALLRDRYKLTLYLKVADGFELPVYLR